jgi:hypothetical protein
MNLLRRIFHVCNFRDTSEPMVKQCSCGRKRWGLYDEGKQ